MQALAVGQVGRQAKDALEGSTQVGGEVEASGEGGRGAISHAATAASIRLWKGKLYSKCLNPFCM